jgi:hypothetical protein
MAADAVVLQLCMRHCRCIIESHEACEAIFSEHAGEGSLQLGRVEMH